jgi:response regulator RpfG family c-di-GMP phosphodiesterase
VFQENIQNVALEMLESIAWDKPGIGDLESVRDPLLKPLSLMLGAIKQDMDYYMRQRELELEKLEELNRRARHLSRDIEQALQRSEEDRLQAVKLSNDNLALAAEIASSQKEVFLVLADYIDRRARFPVGSTRRLARFAAKLAPLFGYEAEDCARLHDAILLMHTGYLAIPEDETDQKLHCTAGGDVLGNIYTFIMQFAAHIARYHHEKWNGQGFPEGRSAGQIPREARLVSFADFIIGCHPDNLEKALRSESGQSLEPAMVDTALSSLDKIRALVEECVVDR